MKIIDSANGRAPIGQVPAGGESTQVVCAGAGGPKATDVGQFSPPVESHTRKVSLVALPIPLRAQGDVGAAANVHIDQPEVAFGPVLKVQIPVCGRGSEQFDLKISRLAKAIDISTPRGLEIVNPGFHSPLTQPCVCAVAYRALGLKRRRAGKHDGVLGVRGHSDSGKETCKLEYCACGRQVLVACPDTGL